jgi:uncharacterized protein involved in outer membrane biogenesis
MKTWVKRIAIGLVGCAILVAAGLSIFLLTFDPNAYKSQLQAWVQQRFHRTLIIAGDIKIALFPRLGLTLQGVTLSERDPSNLFAAMDSAQVAVALRPLLSRRVVVDHVSIQGLKVSLRRNAQGHFNFEDLMPAHSRLPSAPSAAKVVGGGVVATTKLLGEGEQPRTLNHGFVVDMVGVDLKSGEVALHDEFTKTAFKLTDVNVSVRRSSSEPSVNNPSFDIEGAVQGVGRTSHVKAQVKGQLQRYASVQHDAASPSDLRQWALHLHSQLAHASDQEDALQMQWGLTAFNDDRMHLSVKGQLKEEKWDFIADITSLTRTPAMDFGLTADTLNLDKLIAVSKKLQSEIQAPPAPQLATSVTPQDTKKEPGQTPSRAVPTTLNLSALVGPRAQGEIQAQRVIAGGMHTQNLSATIKLANGRLDIPTLSAALYEGKLVGSLSLDAARHNTWSAKMTLTDVMMGPLLADVTQQPLFTGIGTLTTQLTSHGASVDAMKNHLAGTLQAHVREGAIKGVDVSQTLRDLKRQILGPKEETALAAHPSLQTKFSTLDATLAIKAGIAKVTRLALVSPLLIIHQRPSAQIDLPRGTLDLGLNVKVTEALLSDRKLADLRGIVVPIAVNGHYDDLTYGVDWGAMASDMVSQLLQGQGSQSGKPARDTLKDLGNLLKGAISQ